MADGRAGAVHLVVTPVPRTCMAASAKRKPIWEHKAHLVRPALADNDGPFMKFRKWYAQFYADTTADGDERTVFPPPYWPDKLEEAPAKATASARYGDA